jgi:hypothetical protein
MLVLTDIYIKHVCVEFWNLRFKIIFFYNIIVNKLSSVKKYQIFGISTIFVFMATLISL